MAETAQESQQIAELESELESAAQIMRDLTQYKVPWQAIHRAQEWLKKNPGANATAKPKEYKKQPDGTWKFEERTLTRAEFEVTCDGEGQQRPGVRVFTEQERWILAQLVVCDYCGADLADNCTNYSGNPMERPHESRLLKFAAKDERSAARCIHDPYRPEAMWERTHD